MNKKIMPFQFSPFVGDTYVCNEFIKLKEKHNITTIVETGTAMGGTTKFFAQNFLTVYTVEIVPEYRKFMLQHCQGLKNIRSYLGDCVIALKDIVKKVDNNTIFFLDAHTNHGSPLHQELDIIAQSKLKPLIVIHDFYIPQYHNALQYDKYPDGTILSFQHIEPKLNQIYGHNRFNYHYNNPKQSTGAKVGLIYIYPKK